MYHTVQEVADLLKMSRRSVYRMIEAGRLKATKIGREWRISDTSLASLLGKPDTAAEATTRYQTTQESGRPQSRLAGFMTVDEYIARPEDLEPANLIQGLLIRDPSPTVTHQELVGRLHIILDGAIRKPGIGVVYLSPMDVILDNDTVLQPDLLVISNQRREIIGDRIEGAPDLVVEVGSPSTEERDLTTKRLLYARYGVEECWFVFGYGRRLIQCWQPQAGSYKQRVIHEAPDQVRSIRFPTLTVQLETLLKEY